MLPENSSQTMFTWLYQWSNSKQFLLYVMSVFTLNNAYWCYKIIHSKQYLLDVTREFIFKQCLWRKDNLVLSKKYGNEAKTKN